MVVRAMAVLGEVCGGGAVGVRRWCGAGGRAAAVVGDDAGAGDDRPVTMAVRAMVRAGG